MRFCGCHSNENEFQRKETFAYRADSGRRCWWWWRWWWWWWLRTLMIVANVVHTFKWFILIAGIDWNVFLVFFLVLFISGCVSLAQVLLYSMHNGRTAADVLKNKCKIEIECNGNCVQIFRIICGTCIGANQLELPSVGLCTARRTRNKRRKENDDTTFLSGSFLSKSSWKWSTVVG